MTFERAASIFNDPKALSIFDGKHSEQEERWITLGLDQNGVPIVVSHTWHEQGHFKVRVRIISDRKATRNEIQQYKI